MRRFPAFRIPNDYVGVVQPDGGFVAVEPSIEAMVALAKSAGAEVRTKTIVRALEPRAGGVRIATDADVIEAETAIVAAGAWVKTLLPTLPVDLRVTRQVQGWFEPVESSPFAAGRFPVFLLESPHGVHYGFPPHQGEGVKVAKHHASDTHVDPDTADRHVSAADEAAIRAALADHIPAANGRLIAATTCLYTVTPDHDFIIDRMSGADNIIVASPCSGHGFKFAPVIGEVLADLACEGRTRHDISRFRLARFA
jgi:sarcosine oxidase